MIDTGLTSCPLNCGGTPSGECALPLIPVKFKGETIWGFLDTCSTKNHISRQAVEEQRKTSRRTVYSISTYDLRGNKYEVIRLDESSFSKVERESSRNLREKYNHLRRQCITERKVGKHMTRTLFGGPTFIELKTGECRKGRLGSQ